MPPKVDLSNKTFGRLRVIQDTGKRKHGKVIWLCECSCEQGKTIEVSSGSLISGLTQGCRCISKEIVSKRNYKHGQSGTKLHIKWLSMIRRCTDTNDKYYTRYGGRNIRVCDEWLNSFEVFYQWALANGYEEDKEIDRYPNNDGNYEPGNCRFVDRKTNCRNKSNNLRYTIDGIEKVLIEWCELYQMSYHLVRQRIIDYGWDIKRALTTPKLGTK